MLCSITILKSTISVYKKLEVLVILAYLSCHRKSKDHSYVEEGSRSRIAGNKGRGNRA